MSMPASSAPSTLLASSSTSSSSSAKNGKLVRKSSNGSSSQSHVHPHSSSHAKQQGSSHGNHHHPDEKYISKNSYSSSTSTSCTSSSSSYSPYLSDEDQQRDQLLSFPPTYYPEYYMNNGLDSGNKSAKRGHHHHRDGESQDDDLDPVSDSGSRDDHAMPDDDDCQTSSSPDHALSNGNGNGSPPSIPSYFLCPITNTLMTDPVINPEGHTFERASILRWLVLTQPYGGTSPVTGNALKVEDLMEDRVVKGAMEKARKEAWVRYILEGGGEEKDCKELEERWMQQQQRQLPGKDKQDHIRRHHHHGQDQESACRPEEESDEKKREKKLKKLQKKLEKENSKRQQKQQQQQQMELSSKDKAVIGVEDHDEQHHAHRPSIASISAKSQASNKEGHHHHHHHHSHHNRSHHPPLSPNKTFKRKHSKQHDLKFTAPDQAPSGMPFPPPPPLASNPKSKLAPRPPAKSHSEKPIRHGNNNIINNNNRQSISAQSPQIQPPKPSRRKDNNGNNADFGSTAAPSISSSLHPPPPPPPPPPTTVLPTITVDTHNPNIHNRDRDRDSSSSNSSTAQHILATIGGGNIGLGVGGGGGGGASVCSAISTPTIHHNGWMAQLGVYKIVSPHPGLVVTQDVHRRSRTVKRRRRRVGVSNQHRDENHGNGIHEETERPEADLVIPPGSFVNVIETQTHGGRVRGKVVWEVEEENEVVEDSSSNRKGRLSSGLGRTSRFLRRGRKGGKNNNEDLNSLASNSVMTTKSMVSYTGWISLQWAEDDEDDQDILMSDLPPPSNSSVASAPSMQSSVSSRRKSTFASAAGGSGAADETPGPWTHPIPLGVYRVNFGAGLPLRETSERDSPVIEKLERGRVVEVVQTEVKNNRVRARCIVPHAAGDEDSSGDGAIGNNNAGNKKGFQSGWISLLNLSGSSAASPVPLGAYVTVSESGCIVTEGGRLDSKVKEIIAPGSCIEICSTRIEDGVVRGLLTSGGYISLFSSLGKASIAGSRGGAVGAAASKIGSGQMFAMPVPLGTYQNLQDGLVITSGVSSTSPMITKLKKDACAEIVETRVEDGRVRGRIQSVIYGGATTEANGFINLFEPKYRWAKIVSFKGGRPVNSQANGSSGNGNGGNASTAGK